MPADRLLNTVLDLYQNVHDDAKTEQIFGSTTHLLTQLSNPLNLGVLTAELLVAPAIWKRHDGLRTSLRIISIFNTAAIRTAEEHSAQTDGKNRTKKNPRDAVSGGLKPEAWTKAVVRGADDRSERWQHLLMLTGVLLGMEGNERRSLSRSMRSVLEAAVVTAANLALKTHRSDGPLARSSIVLALSFALPLLEDHLKAQLDCDSLLPLAVWTITGPDGFENGHFLEIMEPDVYEAPNKLIHWSLQSRSGGYLQDLEKRPLMGNMGPVARLAAFAIQHARDVVGVVVAHDALLLFSAKILNTWQRSPLSGVEPSYEASRLAAHAMQQSWPLLWQVLKKVLFSVAIILQSVVSRSLLDSRLLNQQVAPGVVKKNLQILRNLFFISGRNGSSSFQEYAFSYLTSLDIISRFPHAAESFLRESRLTEADTLPTGYLPRMLDLFSLNVAEHLPLALTTEACDALIIKPALNYLALEGPVTPFTVELFESAHSAVLSVFSCPVHSALTVNMAPFYVIKLFESFPRHISSRQFRVAFKTVMQIVSPPFPVAATEPNFSETLLEMLRTQILRAGTSLVPTSLHDGSSSDGGAFSEQSALTMALVDSLPFLPIPILEDWLVITAQCLNEIADRRLREPVKARLWEVLSSGEMDVERSALGVAWWGTKGGRELVLARDQAEPMMMSGALVTDTGSSKL